MSRSVRLLHATLPLLVFCVLAALTQAAWARHRQGNGSSFKGRVIRVDSGDAFTVKLDAWNVKVRLHGLDCPREPPTLRDIARQYTERRVLNTVVRVQVRGTGPNNTVYGEAVTALNKSLNKELVSLGLATWARQYAPGRTDLSALESEARAAHRGAWGDKAGADIALPPATAGLLRAAPKTMTPKPTPRPLPTPATPLPTASPVPHVAPRAMPTAAVAPVAPPVARRSPPPLPVTASMLPPHIEARRPASVAPQATAFSMTLPAAFGFAAFLTFGLVVAGAHGTDGRRAPFQVVLALLLASGLTLLAPFLMRAVGGGLENVAPAAIIAGTAAPAAAFGAWGGFALIGRDMLLRGTPRRRLAQASPGLIRVEGNAVAHENGVVQSLVGRIPGIYVREITQRYESRPSESGGSGRGRAPLHWVTVHSETLAADFLIEDESGAAAVVEAGRARVHPLRVARFYNDVPVEAWFAKPYGGDTRTEVAFIPLGAPLTVWGRFFRTASPLPEEVENHIGYDSLNDCLVVVEGDERRIRSPRALLGLLLTFIAMGTAGLTAYCLVTPGAFGGQ